MLPAAWARKAPTVSLGVWSMPNDPSASPIFPPLCRRPPQDEAGWLTGWGRRIQRYMNRLYTSYEADLVGYRGDWPFRRDICCTHRTGRVTNIMVTIHNGCAVRRLYHVIVQCYGLPRAPKIMRRELHSRPQCGATQEKRDPVLHFQACFQVTALATRVTSEQGHSDD